MSDETLFKNPLGTKLFKSKSKSREIDALIKKEKHHISHSTEPRLLVLGTKNSGKTTLIKQLHILTGGDYSELELFHFKLQIFENIFECASTIVKHCNILDLWPEKWDKEKYASLERCPHAPTFIDHHTEKLLTNLWNQPYIRYAVDTKQIPMQDTVSNFFISLADYCDPNYVVTHSDILNIRNETKGIKENILNIKNEKYHIFDISGSDNQRKFWIPYFDNAHTIMFVVSLASYDQMNEGYQNKMLEALEVFGRISETKLLIGVRKIVFLNKFDLFRKKIKRDSVNLYIPDAPDTTVSSELVAYFTKEFTRASLDPCLKVHTTCFLDSMTMGLIIGEMVNDSMRHVISGTILVG